MNVMVSSEKLFAYLRSKPGIEKINFAIGDYTCCIVLDLDCTKYIEKTKENTTVLYAKSDVIISRAGREIKFSMRRHLTLQITVDVSDTQSHVEMTWEYLQEQLKDHISEYRIVGPADIRDVNDVVAYFHFVSITRQKTSLVHGSLLHVLTELIRKKGYGHCWDKALDVASINMLKDIIDLSSRYVIIKEEDNFFGYGFMIHEIERMYVIGFQLDSCDNMYYEVFDTTLLQEIRLATKLSV